MFFHLCEKLSSVHPDAVLLWLPSLLSNVSSSFLISAGTFPCFRAVLPFLSCFSMQNNTLNRISLQHRTNFTLLSILGNLTKKKKKIFLWEWAYFVLGLNHPVSCFFSQQFYKVPEELCLNKIIFVWKAFPGRQSNRLIVIAVSQPRERLVMR